MKTTTTTTEREYDKNGNLIREVTTSVVEDSEPATPAAYPVTAPGWWQQPYTQAPYTVTCGGSIIETVPGAGPILYN